MSKTDKTNPPWVKLARREWGARPRHWHHGRWFTGICEEVAPVPRSRRSKQDTGIGCEIWISYYSDYAGGKVYGRRPKRSTRKALGFEGAIRADLRRLRRQWAYEPDRESIDSSWGAPRRRCQVRDPWHWD